MWWDDGWSMPWMFFPPLMMLLFFIICMVMMVFMMRGRMHSRGRGAIEILEERFARGEINQSEYEERRRLLLRT
jgi:putative membrane protein